MTPRATVVAITPRIFFVASKLVAPTIVPALLLFLL